MASCLLRGGSASFGGDNAVGRGRNPDRCPVQKREPERRAAQRGSEADFLFDDEIVAEPAERGCGDLPHDDVEVPSFEARLFVRAFGKGNLVPVRDAPFDPDVEELFGAENALPPAVPTRVGGGERFPRPAAGSQEIVQINEWFSESAPVLGFSELRVRYMMRPMLSSTAEQGPLFVVFSRRPLSLGDDQASPSSEGDEQTDED